MIRDAVSNERMPRIITSRLIISKFKYNTFSRKSTDPCIYRSHNTQIKQIKGGARHNCIDRFFFFFVINLKTRKDETNALQGLYICPIWLREVDTGESDTSQKTCMQNKEEIQRKFIFRIIQMQFRNLEGLKESSFK